MILLLQPSASIKGTINLPSSKSYSIRSALIAACGGKSQVNNISSCDDAKVALRAARYLGAKVTSSKKNSITISVQQEKKLSSSLNVGESGTVLRFILPLAALRPTKSIIKGEGTLCARPNNHLIETLKKMGCDIRGKGKKQTVPITLSGGELGGGKLSIDGSLSSQFVSALLIAAPLLQENSKLFIKGKKVVSQTYIQMTLLVLRKTGIRIEQISKRLFLIKGKQRYKGLKKFIVPSDYGLAAFWLAAGALLNSDVILKGYFDHRLVQADGAILDFLKRMGICFQSTRKQLRIKGPCVIKGGSFSLKNSPDLLPIMAVMAMFAKSKTRLYGIAHARIKESDRISDLRNELLKVGAKITEKKDEIIIYPQEFYKTATLDPHNDHRLAMAFAILGLKIGLKVKNVECTAKSYPEFVFDLKKIRAKVRKIKNL
ncbi:MAG: 3-phosphoshikimate 1-carboxyvinyltransferase [Candidatus Aceula meridiana]|nr:3-phosphoshikimate 1-carboxyvinyltransferase [Candidatus Aceula meridiana]